MCCRAAYLSLTAVVVVVVIVGDGIRPPPKITPIENVDRCAASTLIRALVFSKSMHSFPTLKSAETAAETRINWIPFC